MKTTILIGLAATGFLFLVASCQKENESLTVSYKIKSINKSATVARMMAGQVDWTSGSGYVKEIEFEAENNTLEVEYEAIVNQRIDLFAPITALGNITLPPGEYKEIEVDINFVSTGTDTAFILRGTFTNSGAVVTPVLFMISDMLEVETEANNVTVNGTNNYTAITSVDLSKLTFGITETMLDNATRTNGVIVISKNINANLYSIFLNNIDDMDSVELDD